MKNRLRTGLAVLFLLASFAIVSPTSASETLTCGTANDVVPMDIHRTGYLDESLQDPECGKDDSSPTEKPICTFSGPTASQPGPLGSVGLATTTGVSAVLAPPCFNPELANHDTVFTLNQDDDRVCETTEESRLAKLCYRPD